MHTNAAVSIHAAPDDPRHGQPRSTHEPRASLRATLRTSTAAAHREIDDDLSRLDLANAADYRRFLRIQLAALVNLSTAWGPRGREDLDALTGCLRTDLSDWGSPPVLVCDADARPRTPFTEAGIAYVVRGSRLGASVLVDRVAPHLPIRYLTHRPVVSWPTFLAQLVVLDAAADRDAIDDCVAAADAAFAVFARASHAMASR